MKKAIDLPRALKRINKNEDGQKQVKRVKPTLISSEISKQKTNEDVDEDGFESTGNGHNNNNPHFNKDDEQPSSTTNVFENPITESFAKLIDACR